MSPLISHSGVCRNIHHSLKVSIESGTMILLFWCSCLSTGTQITTTNSPYKQQNKRDIFKRDKCCSSPGHETCWERWVCREKDRLKKLKVDNRMTFVYSYLYCFNYWLTYMYKVKVACNTFIHVYYFRFNIKLLNELKPVDNCITFIYIFIASKSVCYWINWYLETESRQLSSIHTCLLI